MVSTCTQYVMRSLLYVTVPVTAGVNHAVKAATHTGELVAN